ncbi:MAG: FHA domain-containing protein [Lachnospiraceae bacterium]
MEMKRCFKGHFFDGSKYITCPYCANNNDENDKTMAVMPEELEEIGSTVALEANDNIAFGQDMGSYQAEQNFREIEDANDDKTVPMDFDDFFKEERIDMGISDEISDFAKEEWNDSTVPEDLEDIFRDEGYQDERYQSDGYQSDTYQSEGYQNARYQPEENDCGKTIGVFSMTKVVGWLVCVKGSEKGKDFVLGSGRNFVGRSPSMDVSLPGDSGISRENHVIITYEPRKNNFSISYGTGHGIAYLNGVEILNPMKLEPYDQIELGETILIFIPFCGENFKWGESK